MSVQHVMVRYMLVCTTLDPCLPSVGSRFALPAGATHIWFSPFGTNREDPKAIPPMMTMTSGIVKFAMVCDADGLLGPPSRVAGRRAKTKLGNRSRK